MESILLHVLIFLLLDSYYIKPLKISLPLWKAAAAFNLLNILIQNLPNVSII